MSDYIRTFMSPESFMSPDGTRDFPHLESGVRLLENFPYFTKDCHLVSLQFSRREPTVGDYKTFMA